MSGLPTALVPAPPADPWLAAADPWLAAADPWLAAADPWLAAVLACEEAR